MIFHTYNRFGISDSSKDFSEWYGESAWFSKILEIDSESLKAAFISKIQKNRTGNHSEVLYVVYNSLKLQDTFRFVNFREEIMAAIVKSLLSSAKEVGVEYANAKNEIVDYFKELWIAYRKKASRWWDARRLTENKHPNVEMRGDLSKKAHRWLVVKGLTEKNTPMAIC